MAEYLPRGPLAAYLGVRNTNEAADMQKLGLLAKMQQTREAMRLRQELANQALQGRKDMLGEQIASRETIAGMQDARARELAQITDERQRQFNELRMDQLKANAEMTHQFRLAQTRNDAERAAEIARHNKVTEGIQKQLADIRAAGTDRPPTEFQGKNALYGSRAVMADKVLSDL
jgi:hypothetical protein